MQIKITLRLHSTPIRISKINKITDNKEKVVEKEEPLFTTGQNENWYSHPENQFGEFSEKEKADLPCDPDVLANAQTHHATPQTLAQQCSWTT